jgi:hypothetical protein
MLICTFLSVTCDRGGSCTLLLYLLLLMASPSSPADVHGKHRHSYRRASLCESSARKEVIRLISFLWDDVSASLVSNPDSISALTRATTATTPAQKLFEK